MSLIWTESFAAFRKAGVTTNDDLAGAGYTVTATGAEWVVGDDMIVPNRVALALDAFDGDGRASIGRALPDYIAPVILGVSVYVPLHYQRPDDDSAALLTFRTHESMDQAGSEGFRLRRDLQVGYLTNSPQNISRMVPGRVHYLEVRVSLGEVRVWLDDVFVYQHTSVDRTPLGWSIELAEAGFMLGNLYVLSEDATYPNLRLGRATRVIGERPTADVSVDFERPVNAESNSEVAGQDFLAEPPAVLQGTNVGDEDIYEVAGEGPAAAPKVHALAVKVRAQNADVIPRAVAPFVQSEGETDTGSTFARFHYLEPFTRDDIISSAAVPLYGACVGTRSGQIWFSENGEQFDCLADSLDDPIVDMTVKSNALIALCESGSAYRINFSVVPYAVEKFTLPSTAPMRAIASNDTRVIAVGDTGNVLISPTGERDTWSRISVGASDDYTAVAFADDHWLIASSLNDGSLRASIDDGFNWIPTTATKPSIEGPLRMRTLGGRTIVMGGGPTPIASRLALLGHDTPFYEPEKMGNLSPVPACVDVALADDVYVFAMADGKTLVSEDTVVCQRGLDLGMEPLTVVRLDDGRLLVAGKEGQMRLRAAMPAAVELPVLGGFVNGFASVIRDPATGFEWQPLAAAMANIGVRIVDYPAYGDTGNYLLTERGVRVLQESGRKILLEDFTK